MKKSLLAIMLLSLLFSCDTTSNGPVLRPAEMPEEEVKEPTPPKGERKEIELTATEKQIVERNNMFAFNLFRAVSNQEDPEKNTLISPLSASLALAMLNNGADGVTHQEIQKTLGYGDISREEMNAYFQKMLKAMKEIDPDVAFESANSIWVEHIFPVLLPFIEANKEYYDAEVRNEDFSNPATLGLINKWCAENTHDKIPEILDEISGAAIMYLINALYFNGTWTVPFDKDATKDYTFNNQDGTVAEVPMMNKEMQLHYNASDHRFSLLELPYGSEAFSMVFLLPKDDHSLSDIRDELDADTWSYFMKRMYAHTVKLKIPRFKVEYERELNEDLINLGMKTMFDGAEADFSLISPIPTVVSFVKQKTFLELNEEGTEAAAITIIEMVSTSGGEGLSPPVPTFYLDRPFLYFIKEKSTGTIFFMGQVNNLKAD